jgi:hypothetical protein
MKIKKYFTPITATPVLLFMLTISSCSSTYHSSTARIRNINEAGITETQNMADLTVGDQKVTGTSTGRDITNENAKNLAIYDIEKSGSTTTVIVTGYPGFYKHFRQPTSQDSIIMGWKTEAVAIPPVNNSPAVNTTTTITTTAPVNFNTSQTEYGLPQQTTPVRRNNITSFINQVTKAPAAPQMSAEDLADYKREHKKGANLLGWGLTLFISGVLIDGMSWGGSVQTGYDNYGNPIYNNTGQDLMLGFGSAMIAGGAVMAGFGVKHLIRAKRIKNQATVPQALNFSVTPNFNIASNHYGATLAMKF